MPPTSSVPHSPGPEFLPIQADPRTGALDELPWKGTCDRVTEGAKSWTERAERHPLRIPIRYRYQGDGEWITAETINISESGLLFSSDQLLDVDARIEVTFQSSGTPLLQSSTRMIQVVRRVLSSWPETDPVFGARFCN